MVQDAANDKAEAEAHTNLDVIAVNAAQQASKMAARGEFRHAQAYSYNQKKLVKRSAKTSADVAKVGQWKNHMK